MTRRRPVRDPTLAEAAAIHEAAPGALVTVGTWSEHSVSDRLGLHNYYTTHCLRKAAGGATGAFLDFAQVHSYPTDGGEYNPTSPFRHNVSAYALDKPLVVGEFSPGQGHPSTAAALYTAAYDGAYDGAWGWAADEQPTLFEGMASLRNHSDVRRVRLPHAGLPDTCACSDTPPDEQYTCQEQASWGKCSEDFMKNCASPCCVVMRRDPAAPGPHCASRPPRSRSAARLSCYRLLPQLPWLQP